MSVGATLEAYAQLAERSQPGVGPLDDPAVPAEAIVQDAFVSIVPAKIELGKVGFQVLNLTRWPTALGRLRPKAAPDSGRSRA